MENIFKIFLLDRNGNKIDCKSLNNVKGYDISKYVTFPIFIEEKLNEELDTAQIVLEDFPLKDCIEPKTKIIIERYDNSGSLILPYFHMIVKNDNVESFVGMPQYYTHRINLVEASAVAQGYHVDNIALTYKLQDVDMNYDLNIDLDSKAVQQIQNSNNVPEPNSVRNQSPFITSEYPRSDNYEQGLGAYTYYEPGYPHFTLERNNQDNTDYGGLYGIKSYKFEVEGNYGDVFNNNLVEMGTHKVINLTIPKIKCFIAKENNAYFNSNSSGQQTFTPSNYENTGYHNENAYGTWEFLTYCETITTIKRKNNLTGAKLPDIVIISKPQSDKDVYQEYYNKSWQYEATNGGNITYVALKWDECKEKIKLCSVGFEENQTYDLELDSNCSYEIETKLNTENNQGIIYSRVNVTTRRNNTFFGGVHCYATFSVEAKNFGEPFAKTKLITTPQVMREECILMRQPQKYNLYDMMRKAILTCGDYIKQTDIPVMETETNFVIDSKFVDKLNTTQINETIFYEKNLWEVLTDVGYYIHAIPYIEFLNNEQFIISFRELGKNKQTPVSNTKITIFNSRDIDEYFASLDSYVKNLYNPENEIDEYVSFKTSENNCLVSNNTAAAFTSKPILQVNDLYVINENGEEKNITGYIFEKSIYDTLSFDYDRIPSKGVAIYYNLGSNEINGLTYSPPQKNSLEEVPPLAMQTIISMVFKIQNPHLIQINDYHLRIKYNTVDSSRIKQFKPNLNEMILNSLSDKIPIHEQFYGQEAKFIDSERYGNLLYGELLKNGNQYYQYGEFNDISSLKEVGDIDIIEGEAYYISQVESEWYGNLVLQKILYHKDFNSISKIISIPSEPRFYEISERSKVDREIHMNEFINITTIKSDEIPDKYKIRPRYLKKERFSDFIKGCLLGINPQYPDYAVTNFHDDPDTNHDGYTEQELFINTYNIEEQDGQVQTDHIEVQNKISIHSSQNSLLFEWDMEDNFSAGSYVDKRVSGNGNTNNDAYYGVNSIRYCDIFGRVDLFDFTLVNNDNKSHDSVLKLPLKICSDKAIEQASITAKNKILNKDNRENLSFNFQINLLTDKKINFGRAVWRRKNIPVKILLLDNELSKFSYQNLFIDKQANVLSTLEFENITLTCSSDDEYPYIKLGFDIPDSIIEKVKCIAIVDGGDEDNPTGGMPYIFRNVGELSNEEKLESFLITPINN